MGDQLEKFIMENRGAFDETAPTEKAWSKIEQKLDKKHSPWPSVWKVAAAFFLISTLYLLVDKSKEERAQPPILSEEFSQAESYYVSLITQKRRAIENQLMPEQKKQFLMELDQLDSMYQQLKETHQINASNERVMDAMINNLQLRLEILNRQLNILQDIKNQNHESNLSIEI